MNIETKNQQREAELIKKAVDAWNKVLAPACPMRLTEKNVGVFQHGCVYVGSGGDHFHLSAFLTCPQEILFEAGQALAGLVVHVDEGPSYFDPVLNTVCQEGDAEIEYAKSLILKNHCCDEHLQDVI